MTIESSRDEFDIETLADKTIELLSVSTGQVIWIWASTYSLDLLEALAFRIRQRGAFWMVRLVMESLLRRIGHEVPEPYLGLIPQHELRGLADVTAIIEVRDHRSDIPGVPLTRRRAMGAEWIALMHEAARQRCRRVRVYNPTPALAEAYGVPLATLRQRLWRAVNVDYAALDRQQEQVAARLARGKNVHVTSPLGTDLWLQIGEYPLLLDEDSIPRGEVYVAPREDSAEGVAVIDRLFIRGKPVERLGLTFEGGRVVKAEAPDDAGVAALWEVLASASGDKDVIAEFAIGLNPGVTEAVGDAMLDEKIGGSVHIAVGMNERFGGRNRSNLHLDLVMLCPTVELDGSPIVTAGVLSL